MEGDEERIPTKVLIVDDEENVIRSLTRLCINNDIDVLSASSADEGLRILEENEDISLIISDQRMPHKTGTDFLEQAREIRPLATRILLTGYSDIKATIDAINKGGAYRYLTKPWQDEEILQVVQEAAYRYELIQKNKKLSLIIQRKNEELREWNSKLEARVKEQTDELYMQNESLKDLNLKLTGNFKSTIAALSGLIELRDKNVKNHSGNVSQLAENVAVSMGLSAEETEKIAVAALLHDIGKIGMQDYLLSKSLTELSEEEFNEYSMHPVRGQAAIDSIDDMREIGILIRHHHENFDGSGFPDHIKGNDIPYGARIIAVADFIDQNLEKYMSDVALDLTLRDLSEQLGRRFDPRLYSHFSRLAPQICSRALGNVETSERELPPNELKEGMVVSRDVKSGTGILLLSKNIALNAMNIKAIKRYYTIDPPKRGVFIWVR
jgi:putative nucleotidyltransferase with HDIG domain